MYTNLSWLETATECESPASILLMQCTPLTIPGQFSGPERPRAPSSLQPQEYTLPSVLRARVSILPQAIRKISSGGRLHGKPRKENIGNT